MKLHTAPAILSVAVIASLLLPAGAIVGTMGAPSEDVFDGEPSVEMAAYDGPNGAYVETTGDGELKIDVTDPGVNTNALTDIERVFTLTNTDSTEVEVWVTHDGDESVTLYDDATGSPIEVASEAVALAPGEEITVSIGIDSTGREAGDALLSTVTLHAAYEVEAEVPAPDTDGGAEPEEPVEPTEPIEPTADAEVIFEDGEGGEADSGIEIRTMSVDELDDDPAEDIDRPPRADIRIQTTERGGEQRDALNTSGPDAEEFDTITLVNEPVNLTGERSTIGAAEAITTRDRITQIVDIEVPPERKNKPATVRMRVDRDRLGDTEPRETMIGHRTDDGWELLETRVVKRTDKEIIVEARTPGFSPFAVFSPPNVGYHWEYADGREIEGHGVEPCVCASPTFEDPGLHDVRLTVTDALGRQDTATYRILANDVPEATIEVVGREGDEVTLAANVTDEVGETEVTWAFPDGTEKTGEEVTHTLEEGEHEIGLHVVDEYGAESETEETLVVGPPGASAERVADALGMDLELLIQMGLVSGIGLAIAIGYRQFPWGIFAWRRHQGPKITVFRTPTVDVDIGQFVIDELTVEDPGCELDTVTIEIRDDGGRTLIEKRLDISGMTTYTATPETLTVPPGLDIDPEEAYTVRVKSTDKNGRSTERDLAATLATGFGLETESSRMQAV